MNRRRFLQFLTTAPIVAAVAANTPATPWVTETTFIASGEYCWRDVIDVTTHDDTVQRFKLGRLHLVRR